MRLIPVGMHKKPIGHTCMNDLLSQRRSVCEQTVEYGYDFKRC